MSSEYDIIIIGAGCAGLTAAVYARRAGKSVLILDKAGVGGQISTSPRVENFPTIMEISGMEFSDRLFEQAEALGAQFALEEVMSVTPGNAVTVKTDSAVYTCRALIAATGVNHRHLELPGSEDYEGKGLSYCAVCDGAFFKNKTVAVVGGGNAAVISAVYLSSLCDTVYLIHRRDEFRAEPLRVNEARTKKNIEFITPYTVTELNGNDEIEGLVLDNTVTGEKKLLKTDALFVCLGQIPENSIFNGILELDKNGYIVASEDCRTNQPNIFAAGDCRTKAVRQLTTAAADGAISALAASSL